MKAAIYVRTSRPNGKEIIIHNQIKYCIDKAKSIGIENFKIYCDEGFSSADMDRPSLNKMIRDIETEEFSHIVCYKSNALSRSASDVIQFISEFNKLNINFISISENLDSTTKFGISLLNILITFINLEYNLIQEQV